MPEIASVVHVALAALSILLAIIVLGITSDRLVGHGGYCALGEATRARDTRGCDTGIAISAIGFVLGIIITVTAVIELMGIKALEVVNSKPVTLIRAIASAIMAFLFLVAFGVIVDEFNSNSRAKTFGGSLKNDAQAAAAFSFFSIANWVALMVLYILRVVRGDSSSPAAGAPA